MKTQISRDKKYKIGLCWGVWDLYHVGHLNLLQNAKDLCEKLIVCVSTDEYVLKNKQHNTIIQFSERLRIINSIYLVDEVGFQSNTYTKKDAVDDYKPDVIFVGDDWKDKKWDGAKLGVPVEYLKYTERVSSTIIKNKIEDNFKQTLENWNT